MRVLLNALPAGNRSGTGRYTLALLRALVRRDDLEVAAAWPSDAPAPHGVDEAHLVRLPGGGIRRLWHETATLPAYARRQGFDLLHYPTLAPVRAGRVPIAVTLHDLAALVNPAWIRRSRRAYYRYTVAAAVRHARLLLLDSAATQADLLRYADARTSGLQRVVHLGVEDSFSPSHAPEVPARYGVPPGALPYLGTLEPRKNLVRVVRAFERVAGGIEADLVLAGRDGWDNAGLRRAIAASPQRTRIHLPGFIAEADVPAVLSAARAFVWPSLHEGFGLPPLEAMACGTPVLTSNTTSLPEVVGDAALTVDPADEAAIAEALHQLATDDALRKRMSEAGRARAAPFTWARCAAETVAAYRAASNR